MGYSVGLNGFRHALLLPNIEVNITVTASGPNYLVLPKR